MHGSRGRENLASGAKARALQGVDAALKRRSFTWVGHVGLRVALSHVSEVRERGAPSREWGCSGHLTSAAEAVALTAGFVQQ